MSYLPDAIALACVALPGAALAARASVPWLLRRVDRATRYPVDRPTPHFDGAVYARDGHAHGGWDGWYLYVALDHPAGERPLPVHGLRLSLMTGTYGLDGLDDEEKLADVPGAEALERLFILFGEEATSLQHAYCPQGGCLGELREDSTGIMLRDGTASIAGSWPRYEIAWAEPALDAEVRLVVDGENVVSWADLPGVFSYSAALGRARGTLRQGGTLREVAGRCSLEHGFARKRFDYDLLAAPARIVTHAAATPLVQYLYNVLLGDGGAVGGVMRATGAGVPVRDLGTIILPGKNGASVVRLQNLDVAIERFERIEGLSVPTVWSVSADPSDGGFLWYRAKLSGRPARVTERMVYYDFRYAGVYLSRLGRPVTLAGRGYGEFVDL
jgi:hypothetical protein